MVKPKDLFPVLVFFLSLLLFWPFAIIIAVHHANKYDRRVLIRLTPGGEVEVVGDALDADELSGSMRRYALAAALAGLVAGGLIGGLLGNRVGAAVLGACVGACVGAAVGAVGGGAVHEIRRGGRAEQR